MVMLVKWNYMNRCCLASKLPKMAAQTTYCATERATPHDHAVYMYLNRSTTNSARRIQCRYAISDGIHAIGSREGRSTE